MPRSRRADAELQTALERIRRLECLAETLAKIGTAPDVEGAADALVRGAIKLLDADEAVTILFDEQTGHRKLVSRGDRSGAVVVERDAGPQPAGTFAARIQAGGDAVVVSDFWALQPRDYALQQRLKDRGMRSAVIVPIDTGQQRIGTLHVNHRQPDRFDQEALEVAQTLAAQTGASLSRWRTEQTLREVAKLKDEFVSLVSHELRTPLTSIKGYVDLLIEGEVGELAEEQRDFLGIVKNNADRLVALINDLLDISRIEAGKLELQRVPLDLNGTVQEAAQTLRPQMESKGQTLTLNLAPSLPLLAGDANRLSQVVVNLLSNAHKYTPSGGARRRHDRRRAWRGTGGGARHRRWPVGVGPGPVVPEVLSGAEPLHGAGGRHRSGAGHHAPAGGDARRSHRRDQHAGEGLHLHRVLAGA